MINKQLHTTLSSFSRKLKFLPRGKVGVVLNKFLIPHDFEAEQIISFQTENSLTYICDLRSYTENYICWTGEYEGKTMQKVLQLVDPKKNILDIGANVGYWSINLANKLKLSNSAAKIYAFEPVRSNYQRVLEHLKVNGFESKVEVFNFGLGDKELMAEFEMNEFDQKNQAGTYNAAMVVGKSGQIPVKILDKVLAENSIENVGFVKIDVEGFELSVFRGGVEFLKNNRPVIYGEFTPSSMEKYGDNPNEIFEIFSDYTIYQEVKAGKFEKLIDQTYHRDLLLVPNEKVSQLESLIV